MNLVNLLKEMKSNGRIAEGGGSWIINDENL